jgi:hypothetical protein
MVVRQRKAEIRLTSHEVLGRETGTEGKVGLIRLGEG